MRTNLHINEVCQKFALPSNTFKEMTNKQTLPLVQQGLEDFKQLIRKQRRLLAKELHPDLSNGDADRMKELNQLVDLVEQINVRERQQPQVVVHMNFSAGSNYYASSATTTSWF